MMKRGLVFIIVLLLVIPIGLAKTKTLTFTKGMSELIENINVTLMDFNKKDEKIVLCVNGQKAIITDTKRVNNVLVEIKKIDKAYVKLTLDADCERCKCNTVECTNIECYNECNYDKDCEDYNETTKDFCLGIPRKCMNIGENGEKVISKDNNLTIEGNETKIEGKKEDYKGVFKRLVDLFIRAFK